MDHCLNIKYSSRRFATWCAVCVHTALVPVDGRFAQASGARSCPILDEVLLTAHLQPPDTMADAVRGTCAWDRRCARERGDPSVHGHAHGTACVRASNTQPCAPHAARSYRVRLAWQCGTAPASPSPGTLWPTVRRCRARCAVSVVFARVARAAPRRGRSRKKLVMYKTLADNPSEVFVVRFSPDGKLVATGCNDGAIRVRRCRGAARLGLLPPLPSRLPFRPLCRAPGVQPQDQLRPQLERGRAQHADDGAALPPHLRSVQDQERAPRSQCVRTVPPAACCNHGTA